MKKGDVLLSHDLFVDSFPIKQNIIDLFQGEWSSKMPKGSGLVSSPGTADLTVDGRISWLEEKLGSFKGLNCLELGPLEGAHTLMLHERKIESIVAIEANTRAFLKCLCIKEVFNLNRAKFLLGDFVKYLTTASVDMYDLIIACGVLYHMTDPIELLSKISKHSKSLYIWTHYYDKVVIEANEIISQKFNVVQEKQFRSVCYKTYKYEYGAALDWNGFCGGTTDHSYWLEKSTILDILKILGYDTIVTDHDHINHPNGPAISIFAHKLD